MDLISWGIQVVYDFIEAVGYAGIFLLMTLESMAIPVPSEIVMTFGGWLAYDGKLDLFWVGIMQLESFLTWISYTLAAQPSKQFMPQRKEMRKLKERLLPTSSTFGGKEFGRDNCRKGLEEDLWL